MTLLLRVFLLLLIAILPAQASAAQRVLLPAAGQDPAAGARGLAAAVPGLAARTGQDGRVPVIVGLRVPFAPAGTLTAAEAQAQAREIATATDGLRSRFATVAARGETSFRAFGSLPFVAMTVTRAELRRLATDPAVLSLTEDRLRKPMLKQSVPQVRAPEAWAAGATGAGQAIAIIDTGVDKAHPFLAGKVVSEACYDRNGDCPGEKTASTVAGSGAPCAFADCDHGTHVAGIAAGKATTDFPYSGVAPEAKIVAIQVFGNYPGVGLLASDSDILQALQRVHVLATTSATEERIAAVNMSLGGGAFTNSCDTESPAITAAVRQLIADGIAVVASSGNDGYWNQIGFPACVSGVISVGSVSDDDNGPCHLATGQVQGSMIKDRVDCFSNGSPILSLLAPGSMITSSVPGGGYDTLRGTSMAAPHVAGAMTLLRDLEPNRSVAELLQELQTTGRQVRDQRYARNVTSRIDVRAAVDALRQQLQETDVPLDIAIAGTGRGTVSFSPAGSEASCITNCSSRFPKDQRVTLTASPDRKSLFQGWSGACSGTGPCTVTLSARASVTATFYNSQTAPQTVTASAGSNGSVTLLTSNVIQICNCNLPLERGTWVRLVAEPAPGYAFAGWEGGCDSRNPVCTFKVSGPISLKANFSPLNVYSLAYAKLGAGSGAVEMSLDGGTATVRAPGSSVPVAAGTTVTLTVLPGRGSRFGGWSGDICRGRKFVCTFTMRANVSLAATFN